MDSRNTVSIVIVNYKSAAFTRTCLRTIFATCREFHPEVIVVDNASYDGCGEMMEREYPQAVFIQSSKNLGFAGANNLGVSRSHGDWILYLNPDTEVEGNAIAELIHALQARPNAGLAGAHLLNSDRTVQTSSIHAFPSILNQILGTEYLRTKFWRSRLWGIHPLFENHSEPVKVDAISGACMMARRSAVEQVGGFSTDYFMYGEDLDLCRKMEKAGREIYYVPNAVIVHHGGKSSNTRSESNYAAVMIRETMCEFMRIHRSPAYATMFRFATFLMAGARVALLTVATPVAMLAGKGSGVVRAWRKWCSILAWSVGAQLWATREQALVQSSSDSTVAGA